MAAYKTLTQKPSINIPGKSEQIMDLFEPTYKPGGTHYGSVEVSEDYIARPDLISLAVYSNDEYTDVICKYNGISNPFELNEGMILFIPALDDVIEQFNTDIKPSALVSDQDQIIKHRRTFAKNYNERRSPNQLVEGETNYTIESLYNLIRY